MREASSNPNLTVVMHDGFMGPAAWQSIGRNLISHNGNLSQSQFWVDVHLYQNQDIMDKSIDQNQHIEKVCDYASTYFLPTNSTLPVVVGEWTGATDICVYPNETTIGADSCNVDDCQCSANLSIEHWNAPLIAATRRFFEVQMDVFEAHTRGWFLWSYKAPGAWGLTNAVDYGLVGPIITDRMYPNQCVE